MCEITKDKIYNVDYLLHYISETIFLEFATFKLNVFR
jgi:hypothetical protein